MTKNAIALSIVASIVFAMTAVPASAQKEKVEARVDEIRIHDSQQFPNDGQNLFTLEGVDSLVGCATFHDSVIFRIRDDQRGKSMLSLLTAALLAGKSVIVGVDDNETDANGCCFARTIGLK